MHKLLAAALLCTVMLSGCNVQKIPGNSPHAPTPSPSDTPPRLDVSGNVITTEYAEGEFVKAEEDILTMTENGQTRQFRLSARAKKHISVLGIGEGTRIIVNYNRVDEGMAEAISLEKLL